MDPYTYYTPEHIRETQTKKLFSARVNLITMTVIGAINCILALFSSATRTLPFSACIPYDLVLNGMYFTGNAADSYYEDWAKRWGNMPFFGTYLLVLMAIVAAAVLAVYVVAFIKSKKNGTTWMLVASVMFGLDICYFLVTRGLSPMYLLDYIFHAWMIYQFVTGVIAAYKLRNLSEQPYRPHDAEE